MLQNRHLIGLLAFLLSIFSTAGYAESPDSRTTPQPARSEEVVTDYFGVKVSDPYRWMEGSTDNPQFLQFLKSQNSYARSTLSSLKGRDAILSRIQQLDNAVPTVRSWQRAGNSIFYMATAPGAKSAALLVRDPDGKSRTLLDPVSMEQAGAHAAIDYFAPSWDGRYVLAGISLGGSENSTIRIIESASGRLLPDAITRTQYAAPSWREDSKSFYYSRLQELPPGAPPTAIYENERVYLHVIGSDSEKDPKVFGPGVSSSPDVPKAGFVGAAITPGSDYTVAFYSAGTTDPGTLYITAGANMQGGNANWKRLLSPEDGLSPGADSNATQHQSMAYLLIDKDAPNRKLVALDLAHPDIAGATVLVPPSGAVLTGIYAAKDGLYLSSKRGVTYTLQHADYAAELKWKPVPIPYGGTISTIDANVLQPGVMFRLESWTRSDQAFVYDPAANVVTNTNLIEKHPADFSNFEAREVEATSADGTKVPLSILCKKNLTLDGSHPTLYEGYGAYGISIDPSFDARVLSWLERGGVFVTAHVRGGGEFGEGWHNAGRKETKQHTIDDMIAAAQYLIEKHYTSPEHLAVWGTSAGGIAVGGTIVQRPELFAAAIDNVGMTDMLRFQTTQGGAANVPEFGDVTDPAGFKYLYAVSPYHHVVNGTKYPAVLGITGTNDPRVPSWIVAKMVARLQAATASKRPILFRVDFDEGHGLGSSRPQREQLLADIYSFILWQSGEPGFQPGSATGAH